MQLSQNDAEDTDVTSSAVRVYGHGRWRKFCQYLGAFWVLKVRPPFWSWSCSGLVSTQADFLEDECNHCRRLSGQEILEVFNCNIELSLRLEFLEVENIILENQQKVKCVHCLWEALFYYEIFENLVAGGRGLDKVENFWENQQKLEKRDFLKFQRGVFFKFFRLFAPK